jgi:hypothetical protein
MGALFGLFSLQIFGDNYSLFELLLKSYLCYYEDNNFIPSQYS